MFGFMRLGAGELIVILLVGLIVIGPDKLPEVSKSLGKAVKEFRDGTEKIDDEINKTLGKK